MLVFCVEHYADEQKSQRNLAIFIGVPMLFVILFVAALVIVYYKKYNIYVLMKLFSKHA